MFPIFQSDPIRHPIRLSIGDCRLLQCNTGLFNVTTMFLRILCLCQWHCQIKISELMLSRLSLLLQYLFVCLLVEFGTNGVMIWDHSVVISLCSTNGSPHARPPTNYRWEFQTSNFVFVPDPFFIFLHHVFHISSLCRPDIEFVVPSSPIDLILTRDISISPLCFVTIGLLHWAHEALIQIFFNSVLKIGNLELLLSV